LGGWVVVFWVEAGGAGSKVVMRWQPVAAAAAAAELALRFLFEMLWGGCELNNQNQ
jgi:hypothetical protein